MTLYIVPSIGAGGVYELASPFDELLSKGERYYCKSLRKLSEYYSNNEDPKALIYDAYKIDEAIFKAHQVEDMTIACLQSEKGHWLYVPVSYILKYPDPNGIAYRTMAISISLPALEEGIDLNLIENSFKDTVKAYLGVNSISKVIYTSRATVVTEVKHKATKASRQVAASMDETDASRYIRAKSTIDEMSKKIAELEQYIISKGL